MAPFNAKHVLVLDTTVDLVHGVSTGGVSVSRAAKWHNPVALGAKVFFTPASADEILVMDTESLYMYAIDIPKTRYSQSILSSEQANTKPMFSGCAAIGKVLVAAPTY